MDPLRGTVARRAEGDIMTTPDHARTPQDASPFPLWELRRSLVEDHVLTDLTHAFFPGMPHFPAFPDEEREQVFEVEADGFAVHRHTIVGQWGTHVDPLVTFPGQGFTVKHDISQLHAQQFAPLHAAYEVRSGHGFLSPPVSLSCHLCLKARQRYGTMPPAFDAAPVGTIDDIMERSKPVLSLPEFHRGCHGSCLYFIGCLSRHDFDPTR